MSTANLEISRLSRRRVLGNPWLWLRSLAPRRRAPTDIRDLSIHLRRDIGVDL